MKTTNKGETLTATGAQHQRTGQTDDDRVEGPSESRDGSSEEEPNKTEETRETPFSRAAPAAPEPQPPTRPTTRPTRCTGCDSLPDTSLWVRSLPDMVKGYYQRARSHIVEDLDHFALRLDSH
jgi:hypothetical protein